MLPRPRTLISALLLLAAFGAHAIELVGRVVGLSDGDTITVIDAQLVQHKIRLAGIDAPEKKQPFGAVSQQHLAALVFGREVVVDADKKDRYGRTVGRVLVNGRDAGLEQVAAGLAWHYKAYMKEQALEDRLRYANAEEAAREARRGLWRDAEPVAPWDWRKDRREASAARR